MLLGFECTDECDDERIVGEGHDVAFDKGLFDLIAQDQMRLGDLLHRVTFVSVTMFD